MNHWEDKYLCKMIYVFTAQLYNPSRFAPLQFTTHRKYLINTGTSTYYPLTVTKNNG